MTTPYSYPIAETFFSIQGEGHYTGTPMFFVRLAGCNVGKNIGAINTQCTSWCGEKFICDTDYRHKQGNMSAQEIVEAAKEHKTEYICLTGGEPFIHSLCGLDKLCYKQNIQLNIETSGTKLIGADLDAWITCSPKQGFIAANTETIDEFKFLVGEDTTAEQIEKFLHSLDANFVTYKHYYEVYLQPIQGIDLPSEVMTRKVINMIYAHPGWKLSVQLHKYLGLR